MLNLKVFPFLVFLLMFNFFFYYFSYIETILHEANRYFDIGLGMACMESPQGSSERLERSTRRLSWAKAVKHFIEVMRRYFLPGMPGYRIRRSDSSVGRVPGC